MTKRATRTTARNAELRAALEAGRTQLIDDMNAMMRGVRSRSAAERTVADSPDGAEVNIEDDLDFALIQMKAETLARIEIALRHIDAGVYGNCIDCSRPIASRRLRALPFAVRCTGCEEAREQNTMSASGPAGRRTFSRPGFDAAD
jgi:DnaK suppressor protein